VTGVQTCALPISAKLVFKDEFWLYPSVFAAVLLVIFALFYRDDTRLNDQAKG